MSTAFNDTFVALMVAVFVFVAVVVAVAMVVMSTAFNDTFVALMVAVFVFVAVVVAVAMVVMSTAFHNMLTMIMCPTVFHVWWWQLECTSGCCACVGGVAPPVDAELVLVTMVFYVTICLVKPIDVEVCVNGPDSHQVLLHIDCSGEFGASSRDNITFGKGHLTRRPHFCAGHNVAMENVLSCSVHVYVYDGITAGGSGPIRWLHRPVYHYVNGADASNGAWPL